MLQLMGPWVPIFKSCVDTEQAEFITFSFATVDPNGRPKVRTCVYRGFLFNNGKTNVLTFTTDRRMLKFKELSNDCSYEACFYFHKSKKQFRFSGVAKMIDVETEPQIELPINHHSDNIDETTAMTTATSNEDDGIVMERVEHEFKSQRLFDPFSYPLVSPELVSKYTDIDDDDVVIPRLSPPSKIEWQHELERHWNALSKTMKASFRKPTPGSKMNPKKQVVLDAISRRVDGNKDEVGFENFCVVCLFVDVVDYVNLDHSDNRRFIMNRVNSDQWKEVEVCP